MSDRLHTHMNRTPYRKVCFDHRNVLHTPACVLSGAAYRTHTCAISRSKHTHLLQLAHSGCIHTRARNHTNVYVLTVGMHLYQSARVPSGAAGRTPNASFPIAKCTSGKKKHIREHIRGTFRAHSSTFGQILINVPIWSVQNVPVKIGRTTIPPELR